MGEVMHQVSAGRVLAESPFTSSLLFSLRSLLVVLYLAAPIYFGKLIDGLIDAKEINDSYLTVFVVISFSIILVNLVLKCYEFYRYPKVMYQKAQGLFQQIGNSHFLQGQKDSPEYYANRINGDCTNIVIFSLTDCIDVVINLIKLLSVLILIYLVNHTVFFIILSLIPFYMVIHFALKKPLALASQKHMEQESLYYTVYQKQYQNVEYLKANSLLKMALQEASLFFEKLHKYIVKSSVLNHLFESLSGLIKTIGVIAIAVFGAHEIISGNMSIGEFTVVNAYLVLSLETLAGLLTFGARYISYKVSQDRVNSIVINSESSGNSEIQSFKSIDVSIEDRSTLLIKGKQQFHFKVGKLNILLGNSGVGKSSLLKSLVGVNKFENISISINNEKINNLLNSDSISYMPQEPNPYFSDFLSLYKGNNDYCLDKFHDTLSQLLSPEENLEDILVQIRQDWKNLSRGQLQKVCFAHVISKKASLFLFDEPTASMDFRSKKTVAKILSELAFKHIVILVTHDQELIVEGAKKYEMIH